MNYGSVDSSISSSIGFLQKTLYPALLLLNDILFDERSKVVPVKLDFAPAEEFILQCIRDAQLYDHCILEQFINLLDNCMVDQEELLNACAANEVLFGDLVKVKYTFLAILLHEKE